MEPISDSDSDENDFLSSGSDSDDNNSPIDSMTLSGDQVHLSNEDDDDDSDISDSSNSEMEVKDDAQVLWKGDMSLHDLMAVRDRVGLKKFNKDMMSLTKPSTEPVSKKKREIKRFKREHKRRPQELSSKIKVPKLRQVVDSSKPKFTPRDPRFDDLCGSRFDEESFDKDYSFLDDIREREAKELKKTLSGSNDPAKKKKLKYLLRRMQEQKRAKQHRNIMRQVEEEHRQSEMEKVEKGIKMPYYLTKKRRKELFDEKRAELKKELGTVDTKRSEARKEKKLKQKEKKHMPFNRRLES